MKKMLLVLLSIFCVTSVTAAKRFEKLEEFEAELEKYGLIDIDKECIEGSVEACFVLEKLEKELTTFIKAAAAIEHLQKAQQTPLTFENFPEFLDTYFPGFSLRYKEYAKKMREQYLQEAKEEEMKKLRRMECKTTADVEGMKRYLECGTKKNKNKYKRLRNKYTHDPKERTESSWLSNLRHHKQMCTRYGYTESCVKLQKMRKK